MDVLLIHGLIGVIWFFVLIKRMLQNLSFLKNYSQSEFARNISRGMGWALVTVIFTSMTADPPMGTFWKYTIFWMAVSLTALLRIHCSQEELGQECGPFLLESEDSVGSEYFYVEGDDDSTYR